MANRKDAIEKLQALIHDMDFCMLTTIDDGQLRSRPMSTQKFEFDGDLWFFINDDSHKVGEIDKDNHVNVAYAKPDDHTYVSVSGRASVSHDRAKIEELWNPVHKAWFPEGLDDPHLALLKVEVEQAEYWDSPSGKIVQIFGFLKALATGTEVNVGDHERVDLSK